MTEAIQDAEPDVSDYYENEVGFTMYLHDLADHLFPFPEYREGQGEALYRAVDELYVNGVKNVILDLPTGVGKSPLNVTIGLVTNHLFENRRQIRSQFGMDPGLSNGKSFYTTPQASLRNQLANDEDLAPHVDMLKARADYQCGATGSPCDSCPVQSDPERSCMSEPGCTYWAAKATAMQSPVAALTFAMLIIDNELPPETQQGERLSFQDRDLVIVDEGHGLEGQVASLFAGFTVSPHSLPDRVFQGAGSRADWNDDRFEDVEHILEDVARDARKYVDQHEEDQGHEKNVEQCKNFLRKFKYCLEEISNDRGWVANIAESYYSDGEETKKIELKPVKVDRFLNHQVWKRGTKRVISSATIPFRDDIDKWANRIGLDGDTVLISEDMPFPVENRLIHASTAVGPMSGDDEEENWDDAMKQLLEISRKHSGENGLVHTASYERAERVQDALGKDRVYLYDQDDEQDPQIKEWVEGDKQIMVAPAMMEGVDLYDDLCRWQVLLKCPFAFAGDSRVDYLLNEKYQWGWYYENVAIDIQQAVGRAVRGPEDAASFYILDSKADDVFDRRTLPSWFTDAITVDEPTHWTEPKAAPWR